MKNEANQGEFSEAPTILSDDGTLSEAKFMAALAGSAPSIEPEEIDDPEPEKPLEDAAENEAEPEEETEAEEPEVEPEETEENVLSQIDIDSLSKEEKKELAQMLGSELGKDIAEVRKKNAELTKLLEEKEAEIDTGLNSIMSTPKEFSDIRSEKELDEKVQAWKGNQNYLNGLMLKTDEEFEINGEFYDRKQIAEWQNYYSSMIESSYEYRNRLKDSAKYSNDKVLSSVQEKFSVLSDTESKEYKNWKEIVDDPNIRIVRKIAPKQYATIVELAAKSVMFDSGSKSSKSFKLPLKAPKSISVGSTAAASVSKEPKNRAQEEARKRVQSGDYTEKDLRISMFGA